MQLHISANDGVPIYLLITLVGFVDPRLSLTGFFAFAAYWALPVSGPSTSRSTGQMSIAVTRPSTGAAKAPAATDTTVSPAGGSICSTASWIPSEAMSPLA